MNAKALAADAVAEVKSMAKEALLGEKIAISQSVGPAEYLVDAWRAISMLSVTQDNSALQAHAPGITFRFSVEAKLLRHRYDIYNTINNGFLSLIILYDYIYDYIIIYIYMIMWKGIYGKTSFCTSHM